MYYLSYFCPFGRQKVEKAPSLLHLWLAFSTNAQDSKIREVVTAPLIRNFDRSELSLTNILHGLEFVRRIEVSQLHTSPVVRLKKV